MPSSTTSPQLLRRGDTDMLSVYQHVACPPSGRYKHGLLSARDERRLARGIAVGDKQSRDRLVECNQGLVHKIASDYIGRGLDYEDLVGEGNLGLLRAAEEFDPAFNVRFSTYAAYWIKQAIRAALSDRARTVRLPCHLQNLLTKWRRAEQELWTRTGRVPTHQEIAAAINLTAAQCVLLEHAFRARSVISKCSGEWEGAALDDDPQRELEQAEELAVLPRLLDGLEPCERQILILRFGLKQRRPLTLREIGRQLGMTREWVRKLEMRALKKLRQADPVLRRHGDVG